MGDISVWVAKQKPNQQDKGLHEKHWDSCGVNICYLLKSPQCCEFLLPSRRISNYKNIDIDKNKILG